MMRMRTRKRELKSVIYAYFQFLNPKPLSTSSQHHPLPGLLPPDHDSSPDLSQHYTFLRNSLLNSTTQTPPPNDVVSMSNAIKTGFSTETLTFLRQFRGRLSDSLVVEVMNQVKHPQLCVEFFLWASRQIGYTHTPLVYNALIELLCCNGDDDRVPDKFLMQIKGDDDELLRKLLNVVVQKCCRIGLWNLALEELGRLKDFGYKPSPTTYNALIQVLCKKDSVENAVVVFKEMVKEGVCVPNLITYNVVIRGLCHVGEMERALEVMGRMEECGVLPSVQTYNVVIRYFCDAGEIEKGLDMFGKMGDGSCLPNLDTYNVLISAMFVRKKGEDLVVAGKLLMEMVDRGFLPRKFTFNRVLNGLVLTGNQEFAKEILRTQSKCGRAVRHLRL